MYIYISFLNAAASWSRGLHLNSVFWTPSLPLNLGGGRGVSNKISSLWTYIVTRTFPKRKARKAVPPSGISWSGPTRTIIISSSSFLISPLFHSGGAARHFSANYMPFASAEMFVREHACVRVEHFFGHFLICGAEFWFFRTWIRQ